MKPEPPTICPLFAKKHEDWVTCLASEDRNAVLPQVHRMIWNAVAFRVINEARRLLPEYCDGTPRAWRLLHSLLDGCFFESQILSVRRQLDTYPLSGPRGVYSLRSLINDLRGHRHLLTRQNFFAVSGRTMDLEAARRHEDAELRRMVEEGIDSDWGSSVTDLTAIQETHNDFDELRGGAGDPRLPSDIVSADVFSGLDRQLASISTFIEPVNKLIAHSASAESRALVPPETLSLTLAQLWHAHEIICRCCYFIDRFLLRRSCNKFLAIQATDILDGIDLPLADANTKAELRGVWESYEEETSEWELTSPAWLLKP